MLDNYKYKLNQHENICYYNTYIGLYNKENNHP